MNKIRENGIIHEVRGDVFSGVKDKNGNDIFENDIVKFYYKGEWVECKVFFEDGIFGLQWCDGYKNKYPINSNCEVINSIKDEI